MCQDITCMPSLGQGLPFHMASCAGSREKTGVQWLQGCKWAAITVVVVASPMLGKVSQVGFSRDFHVVTSAKLASCRLLCKLPLH